MLDAQISRLRREGGRRSTAPTAEDSPMVFCLFCHWTKVEAGTTCPTCNTYAPKASPAKRGLGAHRVGPPSVRRLGAA